MNENIPFYSKRGGDPQEKVIAGEFAIGIVPVSKTVFDIAQENNLQIVWPEEGIPWVPEGVAIFKNLRALMLQRHSLISLRMKISSFSKLDVKTEHR